MVACAGGGDSILSGAYVPSTAADLYASSPAAAMPPGQQLSGVLHASLWDELRLTGDVCTCDCRG